MQYILGFISFIMYRCCIGCSGRNAYIGNNHGWLFCACKMTSKWM